MKYLFIMLFLVACSEQEPDSISMSDFVEKCKELSAAVKSSSFSATAWYNEETKRHESSCQLSFILTESPGMKEIYFHHFNEIELNAIQYYKENKK